MYMYIYIYLYACLHIFILLCLPFPNFRTYHFPHTCALARSLGAPSTSAREEGPRG